MECLVPDNVGLIASRLAVIDYLRARRVSKVWRSRLDREEVWRWLCHSHWPSRPQVGGSWRNLGWSMINLMRGRFYPGGAFTLLGGEQRLTLRGDYVIGRENDEGYVRVYRLREVDPEERCHEMGKVGVALGPVSREPNCSEWRIVNLWKQREHRLYGHGYPYSWDAVSWQARGKGDFDSRTLITGFVGETAVCVVGLGDSRGEDKPFVFLSGYRLSDGKNLEIYYYPTLGSSVGQRIEPFCLPDGTICFVAKHGSRSRWIRLTESGWKRFCSKAHAANLKGFGDGRFWILSDVVTAITLKGSLHMRLEGRTLWSWNPKEEGQELPTQFEDVGFSPLQGMVVARSLQSDASPSYACELLQTCPPADDAIPLFTVKSDGQVTKDVA